MRPRPFPSPTLASVVGIAVITASAFGAEPAIKPNALTTSSFKIPAPATATHPGEAAAPASSPKTYPLEKEFQSRADILIAGLATNDLSKWRRGYFASGDPGKYTFGPVMAKLILDPAAKDAIAIQNDDRSYKEQYHFGCVNWSRFLPVFGTVLTAETQANLDKSVSRYSYLGQGGTENHKTMWMTSANVLPLHTRTGRLQNMSKEAALAKAKEALRVYVKGLYAAGQGEWDSSTYLMFDMNGMLNIYDFSTDEDCRLLAKAALDWYATAYALKYTDGVYCAPNQRGFAEGPVKKITDNSGWLWWGSGRALAPADTTQFLWAMHAATSSWRPNKVITGIATRNLPALPFESQNAKPNYWGIAGEPRPNEWQETLYVSRHYTMGSLWKGFGGQAARFQIVAATKQGGVSFTGGTPIGQNDGDASMQTDKFADGNGKFDQSAQVGRAYVMIAELPPEKEIEQWAHDWAKKQAVKDPKKAPDPEKTALDWRARYKEQLFAFFAFPADLKPVEAGAGNEWFVFASGNTYVAVRGVFDRGVLAAGPPDKSGKAEPLLKFPGRRTGFIVETADTATFKPLADFSAALKRTTVEAAPAGVPAVIYTSVEGKRLSVTYQPGAGRAAVLVDGKPIRFENRPVYDNPYVQQNNGVLTVNDGVEGFSVDFTGELPLYKPWKK